MHDIRKIAIIGGTGKAGRFLVKKALEKGFQVKVLMRNPSKMKFEDPSVEVVKGDARDIEAIKLLLNGCDAVINTVGMLKNEEPFFSTVTANVLNVMSQLHINRYILVSGGALDAPGDRKDIVNKVLAKLMKVMFSSMMLDKEKELGILLNSSIDWTLVRLPLISEKPSTGKVKINLEHTPGTKISNMDIAEFLIEQILESKYIKKAPFISN